MTVSSNDSPIVHGTCDPRFSKLKWQFEKNMASGAELGAAVAVVEHGKSVVDLWSGYADKKKLAPWGRDSLVNVFSSTKGISALCVQHAMDKGLLDSDKTVAYFWPEFGCNGKREITLSWLLNHRSGVAALREPVEDQALFDWDYMTSRFAEERPWWEPGTAHGYHMVSAGWMIGEVFHRVLGCSVGDYLNQELTSALGVDFFIGVPDSEFSRVAQLNGARVAPEKGRVFLFNRILEDREGLLSKALTNPPSLMTSSNSDEWKRMKLPSATGFGNARSLATLYGAAVAEDSFLSEEAVRRCYQVESKGMDKVLETPTRFGPGFLLQQLDDPETGFGSGLNAFGHPGSGGSLGFADPERGIGFGYVMNQMGPYLMVDPRARALANAMYAAFDS